MLAGEAPGGLAVSCDVNDGTLLAHCFNPSAMALSAHNATYAGNVQLHTALFADESQCPDGLILLAPDWIAFFPNEVLVANSGRRWTSCSVNDWSSESVLCNAGAGFSSTERNGLTVPDHRKPAGDTAHSGVKEQPVAQC